MLTALLEFIARLWELSVAALRLSPELPQRVEASPQANLLIAVLVVVAGSSLLLGQSVVLFINRVPPGRFVFSLLFYGMIFAIGLALWATSVWLVATALFATRQPLATALRLIGLSSAPLIFGFLIAIPYFGRPIDWVLRVWSLLIVLVAVRTVFQATIAQALLCAILGWLLIQVITRLFGWPLVALRDWLWRAVTGIAFDTSELELVEAATTALRMRLDVADAQPDAASPQPGSPSPTLQP